MKAFFTNRNFLSSVASIVLSVVFVASVAVASTTISTNIVTNGTLQVDSTSTLTGAVTTAGAVTLGDAAGDAIIVTGNASTTNALTVGTILYVGGNATTTAAGNISTMGGLTVGNATANTLAGTILFSAQASDPTGVTQGTVYYNSTSKVLKLFDGTSWFTTGTTTSGISLSGVRLQLADLTTQHVTLGTTTQQGSGQSILTVEATSTTAIPLSLVAYTTQTGDIFRALNSSSAKLLYINSAGALFGSSTLQVTGAVTTYGATTLGDAVGDSITLTGNATSTNNLYVGLALTVNGNATTTSAGAISTQSTLTVGGVTSLANATSSSLYASGTLTVGGNATTTSAGSISTQGKFGVGTTTTPSLEISADSTATTTIAAFSSTALTGGCIQLEGSNGTMYRIYIGGAGDAATTTPSGKVGFILVAEAGSCK
ncbi:MAG: hypothetical protein UX39_C0005G0006 [Candidatus Magasanikbacteria bacterium GW2011_GWA2_46_17]|uniref:Uncharacterized protein n=1 Tax=Candidatus Magasanikbacteria bacterium GW2011_GWA2_46_17 TaxID=1619042 RepID=A0A0G1RAA8_9BACT|nr:MAG: hypothetical protein UX39_C0005G0006 [Candidatus Magasanikbacteria bacterium GW2011_GWA2_46_17]